MTVSPAESYSFVSFTEFAAGCGNSESVMLELQAEPEHALYTTTTIQVIHNGFMKHTSRHKSKKKKEEQEVY